MIAEAPTAIEEINPRTRVLLLAVRQALLLALGALEDYLGMPRTKDKTHK